MPTAPLPLAACLLVQTADGKILAVSRRNSTSQWGLPGGKADGDESALDACIREVSEELGIQVSPADLELVYMADCNNREEPRQFRVVTFRYTALPPKIESMTPENGLAIQYMDGRLLLKDECSPFAAYNRGLFNQVARQASSAAL